MGIKDMILSVLNEISLLIGIPTILGCFLYMGRKFQILDDLKEDLEKVKHNVKLIADFLTRKEPSFDVSKLKHYSPLQLTDNGMAFIKTLGFDRIFKDNEKVFFAFIDEEEPKMKYDVELSSIKSIYFLMDKLFMNFLKQYMYDHPDERIDRLAPTLGVYIRDHYLAEHPEIN
jgi:hypothetical protein